MAHHIKNGRFAGFYERRKEDKTDSYILDRRACVEDIFERGCNLNYFEREKKETEIQKIQWVLHAVKELIKIPKEYSETMRDI